MHIQLEPKVAIALEAAVGLAKNMEFSGFGWVKVEKDRLVVYDYVLLDVGSVGYTEIATKDLVKLSERPDAANMRLWVHRHPVGSGVPGPHNWSGTDEATIRETPLGSHPQLIGWSASIVRTPGGWVGRIDNYKSGQTVHVPVEPNVGQVITQMIDLRTAKLRDGERPFRQVEVSQIQFEGSQTVLPGFEIQAAPEVTEVGELDEMSIEELEYKKEELEREDGDILSQIEVLEDRRDDITNLLGDIETRLEELEDGVLDAENYDQGLKRQGSYKTYTVIPPAQRR